MSAFFFFGSLECGWSSRVDRGGVPVGRYLEMHIATRIGRYLCVEEQRLLRQYLYFFTSKARKLPLSRVAYYWPGSLAASSACVPVLLYQ